MAKTTIERLRKLIMKFELLQAKYAKLGAADTEPDAIFQHCLAIAFLGQSQTIPDDAESWDLFCDEKGAKKAAAALAEATRKVVGFIGTITLAERAPVEEYLRRYCWRLTTFASFDDGADRFIPG